MSLAERDKYTGHMTTGHEWNGIKELNTPVPLVLIGFLSVAFLFAVGYWIVMPAWPLGDTFTKGTSGFDQREHLEKQIIKNNSDQLQWTTLFEELDFDSIRLNPKLMNIVNDSGPALFNDNCAMCHGNGGDGGKYFPSLSDASWLWGNSPESVLHTVTAGINADHPGTRFGLMPAFGNSGVLSAEKIATIVWYLQSTVNIETDASAATISSGKETFLLYCSGCHGEDRRGSTDVGAPDLSDAFWIYGNDSAALTSTITSGRRGHMPAWEQRLSISERKILTLYVLSLGTGENKDARK